MNTFTTFLIALVLAVTLPASAQHEQHHPQQGSMQQADSTRGMMGVMQGSMMGMMQMHMQMMEQMMQNPLHRAAMLVHVLPTLQEPLNLSEDQVTRLEECAQQFKQQEQVHQNQVMRARQQLELLDSEDAAPERVRSLLEEVATHDAQMQALAYETAAQMKRVLSDEQRTKLANMTPMHLHHHMMANMTMMEMMQGGMMPSGMMDRMRK